MAKKNIVILHGWQSQISKWKPVEDYLSRINNVYLPHLPGFSSSKFSKPLTLDDYVTWIRKYLIKKNIKNPILIGHSNGGRIAIKYAAKGYEADKLILISAAGIREKFNLKRSVGFILAKLGKILLINCPGKTQKFTQKLLYKLLREKDYLLADKNLKITMKNIINIDIKPCLSLIKQPTLILWGVKDIITPIKNAYIFKQNIAKSFLKIWKNSGHSLPFEKSKEIAEVINNFAEDGRL